MSVICVELHDFRGLYIVRFFLGGSKMEMNMFNVEANVNVMVQLKG